MLIPGYVWLLIELLLEEIPGLCSPWHLKDRSIGHYDRQYRGDIGGFPQLRQRIFCGSAPRDQLCAVLFEFAEVVKNNQSDLIAQSLQHASQKPKVT